MIRRYIAFSDQKFRAELWAHSRDEALEKLREYDPASKWMVFLWGDIPEGIDYQFIALVMSMFPSTSLSEDVLRRCIEIYNICLRLIEQTPSPLEEA